MIAISPRWPPPPRRYDAFSVIEVRISFAAFSLSFILHETVLRIDAIFHERLFSSGFVFSQFHAVSLLSILSLLLLLFSSRFSSHFHAMHDCSPRMLTTATPLPRHAERPLMMRRQHHAERR